MVVILMCGFERSPIELMTSGDHPSKPQGVLSGELLGGRGGAALVPAWQVASTWDSLEI